ncbi:MAG: repair protein RadC [Thermomicrobiales bacterium]|jgi:DNA repair protein RadC|nr:repair protein RadC [Thermomicrobiales bacterium]
MSSDASWGEKVVVRQFTLKELAPDERPRERLLMRGAASLTNGDLIAIILNTGTQGETVTALAQRLLSENDGLLGLMKMDAVELARIHGLGPAKAAKLKAALEIAARVVALGPDQRPMIGSPDDVVNLVGIEMATLDQEQLRVVVLDTKHRVLAIRTIYQGSVNQAQVRIAEVFREAIRHNAVALIAVHNHPSGDPTPSAADVALTAELARAGDLLDVDVLDHLIIGRGRHSSLRRLGLGFPSNR